MLSYTLSCPTTLVSHTTTVGHLVLSTEVYMDTLSTVRRDLSVSNSVLKCDIILQMFSFKPHHAIYTAAVRMWAKFQITSINESEDREV